ncbi:hypothetical protein [Granulicella sibirica]|uniref:hypothetical protein n=1 Tax=Granulicella sibirica TaxID=2479048 RepID=UPI001008E7D6|nr:hypothetical protein [Granulicella sibirica]
MLPRLKIAIGVTSFHVLGFVQLVIFFSPVSPPSFIARISSVEFLFALSTAKSLVREFRKKPTATGGTLLEPANLPRLGKLEYP